MANLTRTYTFSDGTTAYGSEVETEVSTIVTAWNNHDAGTSAWTKVKISSSETTPLDIISSGATTLLSLDNTALDGDPLIVFKLAGTAVWALGVDDSDSDALCLTAAATMNGTNYLRIGTTMAVGVVNFAVSRAAAGTTVVSSVENSDNTNGASHSSLIILNGGASGGDSYLRLDITGANSYSFGIDNSDSDALCLTASTSLTGTNLLRITTAGAISTVGDVTVGAVLTVTTSMTVGAGTASNPAIISTDANSGIYWTASGVAVNIGTNGTVIGFFGDASVEIGKSSWVCTFQSGSFSPNTTNTISCGASGNIWTAVYATNTTIQTSHSTFKHSIRYITEPCVPHGAYYRWNDDMGQKTDRDYIGWIADPLPKEAYELDASGNPQLNLVHTNAVIGELCAGYWKHEQEIQDIKNQIAELKMAA